MGSSKPYTGFAVKLSHWLEAQCSGVKPARDVVGIGAMIQQIQREVDLASHHRHQQRSVAECAPGSWQSRAKDVTRFSAPVGLGQDVDVHSGGQQQLYAFEVANPRRKVDRGESLFAIGFEIRMRVDERLAPRRGDAPPRPTSTPFGSALVPSR